MDNDHVLGASLERIPEDLPKLVHLNILHCRKIVISIIEDLGRRKPNLGIGFAPTDYFGCFQLE
ncbi:hypothetical protein DPMN_139781 [Dreissena polymorpha]|uniref:Uncharacterized protein n=1 Tax=Dreissena polymorpha TaxID=45954 RepID=A0A9D4JGU0_DREPO|nr:hypothetical protein DPMN_139781 [Dreissena polymorpha]